MQEILIKTQNKPYMLITLSAISILAVLGLMAAFDQADADSSRVQYWSLSPSDRSRCAVIRHAERQILTTPIIMSEGPWDDLVISWNAKASRAASLEVYVRVKESGHLTGWYDMGYWTPTGSKRTRTSKTGQNDSHGEVSTDILRLKHPASAFQVRLVMKQAVSLRYLGVSLANRKIKVVERAPNREAWGRILSVPEYSQRSYPKGRAWCSPTSVAMLLNYWADVEKSPDWRRTVPQCAAGVYDKAWSGTGNWSFNMAYAGSLPGMQAYAARLADIRPLEDWIAQGVPVAISVSLDLSKGELMPGDNGHLIVCIGFTSNGDLVVNDPWTDLEHGEAARRIIPRDRLASLWRKSEQTAYIVHPITLKTSQENTNK